MIHRISFVKWLLLASALMLGAVGLVFAGGTGEKAASAGGAATYAVVLKTLANPFWVAMKTGIEAEAQKEGIKVDILAAQSEDDLQGQLNIFEDLLGKNYKGIAFAPISPVNLIPAAAQAYKKGIFLVNIDEKVDMQQLKAAGANVFAFVTTDNVKVGAKAATFMVKQIGSAGGNVAIIEGKAGNASGEARKQGASQVFSSTPGFTLVASQPADWDRTRALDVATNMIQRFPDLKGIYCANDTMALGAQQAVENAGKAGQIIVVGTDGIPEAVQEVKDGKMAATVAQDPAEVGAESLRQLVKAVQGGKQIDLSADPVFVAVESKLITK
jgi:D-allose transport system substrate-binding protein